MIVREVSDRPNGGLVGLEPRGGRLGDVHFSPEVGARRRFCWLLLLFFLKTADFCSQKLVKHVFSGDFCCLFDFLCFFKALLDRVCFKLPWVSVLATLEKSTHPQEPSQARCRCRALNMY